MAQKMISGHDFDALRANRDNPTAALVLEDGTTFTGLGFGAATTNVGEVCFNTSMTGYQEIMTDPSYAGQIVNFTFPHICTLPSCSHRQPQYSLRASSSTWIVRLLICASTGHG